MLKQSQTVLYNQHIVYSPCLMYFGKERTDKIPSINHILQNKLLGHTSEANFNSTHLDYTTPKRVKPIWWTSNFAFSHSGMMETQSAWLSMSNETWSWRCRTLYDGMANEESLSSPASYRLKILLVHSSSSSQASLKKWLWKLKVSYTLRWHGQRRIAAFSRGVLASIEARKLKRLASR